MFVKAFKIITSLVMTGALLLLVANRNLSNTVETKIKETISNESASIPEIPSPIPLLLKSRIVRGTSTAPLAKGSAVSESKVLAEKAPEITQPASYAHLEQTGSDIDGTYTKTLSPCKEPIGFKVGTFDDRFGISRSEFIQAISQAAGIWEGEAGKSLFIYNADGPLTINLIYDDRQAKTENIGYLSEEIDNSKQSAEKLRTEYEAEKVAYEKEGELFAAESAAFKQKYDSYESRVQAYNAQGGAPKDEYDKMMTELASLQDESRVLETKRQNLLSEMNSINEKVNRYNEFVVYVNNLIKKSNSLGTQKFTEGRFTPMENKIDIYQYNDKVKLVRVLAHELGHALGIDHNANTASIMYSVNSGNSIVLTAEDKAALHAICN